METLILQNLYNKLVSCYVTSVYKEYEQKRYGINHCMSTMEEEELSRYEDYMYILKVLLLDYCDNNTLEPYKNQTIYNHIYNHKDRFKFKDNKNRNFRNPIYGKLDCEDCNIDKIINKIKAL